MFEVLLASLIKWNSVKNERQKLQHSYSHSKTKRVFSCYALRQDAKNKNY